MRHLLALREYSSSTAETEPRERVPGRRSLPKLIAVCVPLAQGSHRLDTDREVEIPAVGQPAGAIPVTCPRNSCMIFDRRLLHAASTNWAGDTRYFAIVGYAYRWLKPKEPLNVEAAHATAT